MNRIAKFEKISFNQFKKDWLYTFPNWDLALDEGIADKITRDIYDEIKIPRRATCGSAGYDFYVPYDFEIEKHGSIKIPTGIRCKFENDWVLMMYPRSNHGFRYGLRLANTVGIIDSDYYNSDNEGHIFIKLVNDSILEKNITFNQGDAFGQGIFLNFGITVDDDTDAIRNGGLGSTNKKKLL